MVWTLRCLIDRFLQDFHACDELYRPGEGSLLCKIWIKSNIYLGEILETTSLGQCTFVAFVKFRLALSSEDSIVDP
jgi:hypothetical protein